MCETYALAVFVQVFAPNLLWISSRISIYGCQNVISQSGHICNFFRIILSDTFGLAVFVQKELKI